MKIAIYNPTMGGISGGYKTYLLNMIPRLAVHGAIKALLCVAPKKLKIEKWFPVISNVYFRDCESFSLIHHRFDKKTENFLSLFNPDIVFIPMERHLNIKKNIPTVIMMQNMGPFFSVPGNPLSEKIRYFIQRHKTKMAMKRANHIIAPSQFVSDFISQHYSISKNRINVVYYGAPRHKTEDCIFMRPKSLDGKVLPKQFIFTAGSIEPYRGLEDILGALTLLKDCKKITGLVIAGTVRKNMKPYMQKIQKLIIQNNLSSKVFWLGELTETEMAWCYKNCFIFAMTSRVESFGIIGVEALSFGCICVTANNKPFPEIFQNSSMFYQSGNIKELANILKSIIDSPLYSKNNENLKEMAIRRSEDFSWDITCDQTIEVFKKVINSYQQNN